MTAFFCGAVKTAIENLHWPDAPNFVWGTVGALRDRVLAGERPSVVVLSDAALEVLAARGIVARGAVVRLGTAGTGLAVHVPSSANPHPDPPQLHSATSPSPACGGGSGWEFDVDAIATPEALRSTLLSANSIAWADASSGATAGKHFEAVIESLGIADAIRAKAMLHKFGVEAVAACGRGEVELAVSQVTEIVNRPGVALLGELPPPYDLSTGYVAAPLDHTPEAQAILVKLTAPETRAALIAIGFRQQEQPA